MMIKAKYQKMYTEKYKQDMDFVIIGDYYLGPFIDMDVAQKAVSAINKQLVPQPNLSRTEYEKVTESIFDLKDEFERGELVSKVGERVVKLESEKHFVTQYSFGYIHRKVEKKIDWRDEVHNKFQSSGYHWSTPIAEVINDELDCFLDLCRVTLRATGELNNGQ